MVLYDGLESLFIDNSAKRGIPYYSSSIEHLSSLSWSTVKLLLLYTAFDLQDAGIW